jgi:hypothetical protein
VKFAYEVDGRRYESDLLRLTVIVQDRGSRSTAEQEIAAFPVGATVEAYYGVDHPAQAYLILEKSPGPVVFILVGLIVPVAAWFGVKLI